MPLTSEDQAALRDAYALSSAAASGIAMGWLKTLPDDERLALQDKLQLGVRLAIITTFVPDDEDPAIYVATITDLDEVRVLGRMSIDAGPPL